MKCLICEWEGEYKPLTSHIKIHKIKSKEYYDKYLKQENEGLCKICKKITSFKSIKKGYAKWCSIQCSNLSSEVNEKRSKSNIEKYIKMGSVIREKTKKTCLKKYGVENPAQNQIIENKRKNTCIEKYGVVSPSQNQIFKNKKRETCLKNWDVENPSQCQIIKNKKRETCLKNWGVENPLQSKEIKNKQNKTYIKNFGGIGLASCTVKKKYKQTCLDKYNVECFTQYEEMKNKSRKTCLEKYGVLTFSQTYEHRLKMRKNTLERIENQKLNNEPLCPMIGTNERICLNELQTLISYEIKRQQRILHYFPDGFISELNLIIEYDEKEHFINENYCQKDIYKNEDFIRNGYKMFRIKDSDWLINKDIVIQKFKEVIDECRFIKTDS